MICRKEREKWNVFNVLIFIKRWPKVFDTAEIFISFCRAMDLNDAFWLKMIVCATMSWLISFAYANLVFVICLSRWNRHRFTNEFDVVLWRIEAKVKFTSISIWDKTNVLRQTKIFLIKIYRSSVAIISVYHHDINAMNESNGRKKISKRNITNEFDECTTGLNVDHLDEMSLDVVGVIVQ